MSVHKDLEKTSAASTAASGGPDVRQGEVEIANYLDAGIKRGLKSRHIQMIALGGSIGTGLFVASGTVLATSGPLALLLGYIIMSVVVWSVVSILAEMTTYLPLKGSTVPYLINRYLDPSLAFAAGWNYWFALTILVPVEVNAAGLVIQYWTSSVNIGVWITIFLVVIIGLNLFGVELYGESEFWFCSIKFFTIVGLLILSVVIFFGGVPNSHGVLGFHYWKHPGAVNEYLVSGNTGRFLAVWSAICKSALAFVFAPELLITTAGEVKSPRRNIPKAATRFAWRLIFFYVLSTLAIGVIIPSNDKQLLGAINAGDSTGAASPFVAAILQSGIHGLDSVINAVILTSAWSSGNAWLYASSRNLYTLALEGHAPRIFARTTKKGNPYAAVLVTSLFSSLAYLTCSSTGITVFNWFTSLATISGLIAWIIVYFTFLRFRAACKYRGIIDSLPFKAGLQPYISWFGIVISALVTIFNGFYVFFPGHWNTSSFFTAYISIPIFLVFYIPHKIYYRTPMWIPLELIDVLTGKEEMDQLEAEDEPRVARNWAEKVWFWVA